MTDLEIKVREIDGWIWWAGLALWLAIWDVPAIITESIKTTVKIESATSQFREWTICPTARKIAFVGTIVVVCHLWQIPRGLSSVDPFNLMSKGIKYLIK